jgi:hypothetical protein
LNGQKAQLITLSISGNDFLFGNVMKKCMYHWSVGDSRKDSECNQALAQASQVVNSDTIWALYREKVEKILRDVAIKDRFNMRWSVLVITGYAKFFAPASEGNDCSSYRFPIPIIGITGNLLRVKVWTQTNTLVDIVNRRISSEIIGIDTYKIKFVNIDEYFEGHRFRGKKTDGADDPDVWFISLQTTLEAVRITL